MPVRPRASSRCLAHILSYAASTMHLTPLPPRRERMSSRTRRCTTPRRLSCMRSTRAETNRFGQPTMAGTSRRCIRTDPQFRPADMPAPAPYVRPTVPRSLPARRRTLPAGSADTHTVGGSWSEGNHRSGVPWPCAAHTVRPWQARTAGDGARSGAPWRKPQASPLLTWEKSGSNEQREERSRWGKHGQIGADDGFRGGARSISTDQPVGGMRCSLAGQSYNQSSERALPC